MMDLRRRVLFNSKLGGDSMRVLWAGNNSSRGNLILQNGVTIGSGETNDFIVEFSEPSYRYEGKGKDQYFDGYIKTNLSNSNTASASLPTNWSYSNYRPKLNGDITGGSHDIHQESIDVENADGTVSVLTKSVRLTYYLGFDNKSFYSHVILKNQLDTVYSVTANYYFAFEILGTIYDID